MTDMKNYMKSILALAALISLTVAPGWAGKITVGVAWIGQSGMADRVEKGLMETLAREAPHIEVETRKSLPDLAALDTMVKKFQKTKTAMIVLRSSGAHYLGTHPPAIPTFIGGCNDPVQLGVIKDMQSPRGNVTGVTYALPHATQLKHFTRIYPEMKSILLLYQTAHPGSPVDRQGTRQASKTMGLTYQEYGCGSVDEAREIIRQRKSDVDAIVLGNQALLFDNALSIITAAGETPVFSYTKRPVYDGALGGLSANDVKLGRMLGKSVIDVLVNGKAIGQVPVKTDPSPRFYVNIDSAERMNLHIGYDILNSVEIVR